MKKIIILVVLGALAVGLWLVTRPSPQSGNANDNNSSTETASSATPEAKSRKRPRTVEETAQSEAALSTSSQSSSALEILRSALQSGDENIIQAALKHVSEDFKNRPEILSELLSGFKNESDGKLLNSLVQILGENRQALTNQAAIDTALQVAGDNASPEKQHLAFFLLGKTPEVSSDLLQSVARMTRESADTEVRNSAIATMATWMSEHSELMAETMQQLSRTITVTSDDAVRGNALQLIALYAGSFPESAFGPISEYLQKEPNPYNRAMAARVFGAANDETRGFAVQQLEQAYARETDLNTRRNILSELVRAGRSDALPILKKYPANEATVIQDVNDYVKILESGATDPDEIMRQKAALDAARQPLAGNPEHEND